ncbi:MAG: recombinase RecQ, partial [Oceanospirillaceae bacterium]|nr:recombinase RecQ [Oceanospirillaceae bacterium]
SVCRGNVLTFTQTVNEDSSQENWQGLAEYVQEFAQHLGSKSPTTSLSAVLVTRYLTGLTQPILTKIKARQLNGFGIYEERRYLSVLEAVSQLLTHC